MKQDERHVDCSDGEVKTPGQDKPRVLIIGSEALCERLAQTMNSAAVRAETLRVTPAPSVLHYDPPSVIVLTGSAASDGGDFCQSASSDVGLTNMAILLLGGGAVALAVMDLPRVAVLPPDMDARRIAPVIVGLAGWGDEVTDDIPVWKRVEALLRTFEQRVDQARKPTSGPPGRGTTHAAEEEPTQTPDARSADEPTATRTEPKESTVVEQPESVATSAVDDTPTDEDTQTLDVHEHEVEEFDGPTPPEGDPQAARPSAAAIGRASCRERVFRAV